MRGACCAIALLPILPRAASCRGAEGQVLGVMTHFAQGWDSSLTRPIADAGIRSVRDELYWQEVEPQRGLYRFPERFDRYMAALRGSGISPLIELTFANRAYDGGLTPYTDEGLEAYARYGVEVLRHYGAQVAAVEVWNEYNGSFCEGPAAINRADTYARMLRVAYRALKKERPDLVVAGGATAGIPLPYLERLFARGALDSMDVVSVHPYRYDSEPEGIEADVAGLQELITRYNHGASKPIWVTEIGWGTKAAAAPMGLAIDEGVQASFLVRACALLISAGVERTYWYLFRDYGPFATMGLVRGDERHTPKKAYRAMQMMIAEVGNARFVRREDTPADLYSILFERDSGAQVRVVWSLQPTTVTVPASCVAVGMLGDIIATGGALSIRGEPVFVEGPLAGLPAADPNPPEIIADSARDFSDTQGRSGWSYGMIVGEYPDFVPLKDFRTTDWKREWYARYPYLSLTNTDQHPSESQAGAVAAVRRWISDRGGRVRISARFQCGPEGDGVLVKVLLERRELFSGAIGGPQQAMARFDSVQELSPGSRLDFAVFPGPRRNANFDATQLSVTITRLP